MSQVPAIGQDFKLSAIQPKSSNRLVAFFQGMNHSAIANIHEAGSIKPYKVPAGLEKLFEWAFKPVGQVKDGLLRKIGQPLIQGGFKLLQLPVVNKLSPFVQYNLLFGAATGVIGSAYNLVTGKPAEAVHGLLGNAAVLAANAFASLKVPAMLGISAMSGWGALIGFGLSFIVDPLVRKLTGLDKPKEPSFEQMMQQGGVGQMASPLAAQQLMGQAQQAQYMPQSPFASNPYQAQPNPFYGYQQAGYNPYASYGQSPFQQPYQDYGAQAVQHLQKSQETRQKINEVLARYKAHFGKDLSAPPPVDPSEAHAAQVAQYTGYMPPR